MQKKWLHLPAFYTQLTHCSESALAHNIIVRRAGGGN